MAVLPAGIEFDDDEDVAVRPRAQRPTERTAVPRVRSRITATGASDRLVREDRWTWEQLRDYVLRMIEKTSGAHVQRDPKIEASVFSAFLRRHGADAPKIARWAFETSPHPGYWRSAPIRPTRFTKNSDPYFAEEILAKLG